MQDLFLRYTRPGDVVIEPFLGIGSSFIGAILGRHVIGVELEEKFARLARQNAEKICRLYADAPMSDVRLGQMVVFRGDSRRLPFRSADLCVTLPPYLDARQNWSIPEGAGNIRYGTTQGQIAELSHGDVAGAIASPPYADSMNQHSKANDLNRRLERMVKAGIDTRKMNIGGPNSQYRQPQVYHVGSKSYGCTSGYGAKSDDPANIGNLPPGDASGAIGSPPFESSGVIQNHPESWTREMFWPGKEGTRHIKYAELSQKNIGRQQDEDYCSAVLQVYRELYRVIRDDGVLVLITGDYIRNGKRIDLAGDTIKLAEAAGWALTERWKHVKSTISFWRRLHAQRSAKCGIDPESVTVTDEDVLVFVKKYQGWEFTKLAPTIHPPAKLLSEQKSCAEQVPLLEL